MRANGITVTTTVAPRVALSELLKFSLPIILGQIGLMLINTGDMIIAGQFSRECLAAIGLAIAIANPIQISFLGMQFSISPLLAQKRGGHEDIRPYFWTVITYSLLISLVSGALTFVGVWMLPLFGYSENINALIREYLIITSFSTTGMCLYQGMKEYFQASEKTFAANSVALICAVFNLVFNYLFVFGKFGLPELKEAGLAWASLSVRMLMGSLLFVIGFRHWKNPRKIHWKFMLELFRVGGPIAITLFFEILAFCSVTLFVGKFAEVQTAANNLVLNIGSLAFMIPLSVSAAVAVKVGHAYGEKNLEAIKLYGKTSLLISFVFTFCMAALLYIFPHTIMSLYTDDLLVLDWSKKLLFWVACFQFFDGAQVTLAGILRGLSITKTTSMFVFIGYWLVGIPFGYYLGFYGGLEAQGFWIGLATSLAVVALMLAVLLNFKLKELKRVGMTLPEII